MTNKVGGFSERELSILKARQRAESHLRSLAAAILRMVAESKSAPPILPIVLDLVAEQRRLEELTGSFLTKKEERQTLALPKPEAVTQITDWTTAEAKYWIGFEMIVKGSLRVAATRILSERDYTRGKYSSQAVLEGIKTIVESSEMKR